jgi:integrative and conjugative element protein (TIGR02256 family)
LRLPRRYALVPEVLQVVVGESERAVPTETGGVLVGRNLGPHLLIEYATLPGPKAEHSPTSFRRDGDYTQAVLESIYESSGGISDYLGEWHSHPTGLKRPSPRDVRSIRWIADNDAYAAPEPILGLSVRESKGWRLSLYIWQRGRFWPMDLGE